MQRIAITRGAAANLVLETALADLEVEVIALPVTETSAATSDEATRLAAALGDPGLTAVVVASVRASEALLAAPDAATRLAGLAIYAVGDVTAEPLRAAGLDVRVPMVHHARGLLALVEVERGADLRGQRFLYPRAAEARPELGDGLRAAGAEVIDAVAYRTVAAAADAPELARGVAALRAGQVDLLVAYAPSQLHALAAMRVDVGAQPVVCVGPTTADAARALGASSVHVADAPTAEAVAAAVRAVYAARHELP